METSMISHPYRILLGASLALLVGAAGAQNAPDSGSRMPAEKGTTTTMPAQPSEQPTEKMSADPNAGSQGTKADTTQSAPMRHAHKSAPRQEAVSPEEKTYRQALRQCVQERDESQRDACIDNAIGQR
jgi:uncharacterized protein involved in copper resistance